MDDSFLQIYNTELRHIREMAGEFAEQYPKAAARLGLQDRQPDKPCPDPYVERLVESFAFLSARVQRRLDAEFPRFTQSLLETIYPTSLSPTPSMLVVQFHPDLGSPALSDGHVIARGELLRQPVKDRQSCLYALAHEVKLWPLEVAEAFYCPGRDLERLFLPEETKPKPRAALCVRLRCSPDYDLANLSLEELTFHLHGGTGLGELLYENVFGLCDSVCFKRPGKDGQRDAYSLPASRTLRRVGLEPQESLLPVSAREFEGNRLLREYFAMPERFLFFQTRGMAPALKRAEQEIDVIFLLRAETPKLENQVTAENFRLFCAPAINLFPKQADLIEMKEREPEFQVVMDRMAPLDYEVFSVLSVRGLGLRSSDEQEFRSFYHSKEGMSGHGAYYATHRAPRLLTEEERRVGAVGEYAGSEVYLSLVDVHAAPYSSKLRHLEVSALCTNRHLPVLYNSTGRANDLLLDRNVPLRHQRGIVCLVKPTKPRPAHVEGDFAWRAISQLSLNYVSLLDDTRSGKGASALRDTLKVYAGGKDDEALIESLRSIRSQPITRRWPGGGAVSFVRGLEMILTFDERGLENCGAFLLGSVLERFLAKAVSLNSFTETVISTEQRGELKRWPPQIGTTFQL